MMSWLAKLLCFMMLCLPLLCKYSVLSILLHAVSWAGGMTGCGLHVVVL